MFDKQRPSLFTHTIEINQLKYLSLIQSENKIKIKMKIALTLNTYLVPNIDNPIIRIPIWQETQTFETHIIGDITIEKILIVYVAYKKTMEP